MCIRCGADDPDLCPHGLLARITALEAQVEDLDKAVGTTLGNIDIVTEAIVVLATQVKELQAQRDAIEPQPPIPAERIMQARQYLSVKVNAEPPRGANGEAWSAWRRMGREA